MTHSPTSLRAPREKSFPEDADVLVLPPDGGWGWLVTASCFCVNFITDGMFYGFGVFLDEIALGLRVTSTEVALTSSIMTGFFYTSGPVICAMINRYGFRPVGVLGGVLTAAAFLIASFLRDLKVFLAVLGILGGCGAGMLYIGNVITVGFYFARWRALALALAASGTAFGMIAFPPFMMNVCRPLHWRDKFRIIGGLFLLCSFCAVIWRPLKPTPQETEEEVTKRVGFDAVEEISLPTISSEEDSDARLLNVYKFFRRFQEMIFPTVAEEGRSIVTFDLRDGRETTSMMLSFRTSVTSAPARSFFSGFRSASTLREEERESKCKVCCTTCWNKLCVNFNRPMYRDDIFYPGSIYILPQYSKADQGRSKRVPQSYHKSVTRAQTVTDLLQSNRCVCCPEAFVRALATMLNFQLLKSIPFFVLLLSGMFTALGMYTPYIFVIKRAQEMRIEEHWSVLLLSFIGVANIVGRMLCGAVSLTSKVDAMTVSYVATILCGLSIIISCYTPSLEGQLVFVTAFGFTIATLPVLRAVVIVDLFGLEHLTNGFGLNVLFQGLACFLGLPISGTLYKVTGTYEATFLFSGCAILLSGLMLLPIKKLVKWENKKKQTW